MLTYCKRVQLDTTNQINVITLKLEKGNIQEEDLFGFGFMDFSRIKRFFISTGTSMMIVSKTYFLLFNIRTFPTK